jgi:hypothetical protein
MIVYFRSAVIVMTAFSGFLSHFKLLLLSLLNISFFCNEFLLMKLPNTTAVLLLDSELAFTVFVIQDSGTATAQRPHFIQLAKK